MALERDNRAGRTDAPAPAATSRWAGIALMLGSALSNQSGASLAALAFPVMGPVGVVAVRQWVAAVVLLVVGRPRLRAFTATQWRPILALAVVFATMNLSLYLAIDRIGLGLAVTLEFLGPLAIAVASSRRRRDVLCALVAAAAVGVLTRPQPSTDYVGIGFALLAAVCWAGYILLNRSVGARVPGLQGSAAAAALSGLIYLPVGCVALWLNPPTLGAMLCALAAGVLSSAVPFLTDLLALRRVPARFFGIFMSVNPVFASVIGMLVLDQQLDVASWLAVVAIVAANTISASAPAQLAAPENAEPKSATN
ncbi:EamA family transporter [Paramicrobacterium fandaimingii]|uniref:EamA family transporter n=1 Tax=Paramicrobacterium fandaimingii TaxID=2708079 RepID=UPI001F1817AA|nr:EamA family transporter [Microbacterium fandaimingii]